MFVQGTDQHQVQTWVDTVHSLRYKDYQLACSVNQASSYAEDAAAGVLEEVETVKEMAMRMDQAGLMNWWRKGMGFDNK